MTKDERKKIIADYIRNKATTFGLEHPICIRLFDLAEKIETDDMFYKAFNCTDDITDVLNYLDTFVEVFATKMLKELTI